MGKYAANETIQALKDKNEDIIKGVNDFSEKSKRLFNDMFEAKKSIIDKFANEIEETRKKLIKAHQDVEEKITQLDETAKKELENFDEKFKTIFGDKLVTWQNLNVSNYKNFTKFAFGFYAMNFCFALILGVLGATFIGAKKNYDAQAEILREKGTNRSQFFRGQVAKYNWVDFGDSYLQSDLNAAYLWAQLEKADEINENRLNTWNSYNKAFSELQEKGIISLPVISFKTLM